MKIRIDDIAVKKRIRKDIGDLGKLINSMKKYGLINPITINDKMELLAGFRRLESAKAMGWKEINCSIVSAKSKLDKLVIEAEENLARKDFTPEEIVIFEDTKRYLTAGGLKRIILWLIRIFNQIVLWIKRMIAR